MAELASILMPCWNSGKYLKESVASALAQTYAPLELIIADDGSDDPATLALLDELDAGDSRIRVIHVPHGGPSAARNAAARAARGTYLLPLDSDDLIDPPYLARGIEILARDPGVGVVCCNGVFFGDETGPMTRLGRPMGEILAHGCLHLSGIFRRADFERFGGYDETLASRRSKSRVIQGAASAILKHGSALHTSMTSHHGRSFILILRMRTASKGWSVWLCTTRLWKTIEKRMEGRPS